MSRICLTVTEKTIDEAIKTVSSYKEDIDIVELRIDYLEEDELNNLDGFEVDFPVIATYRKVNDGGLYSGNEEFRIEILKEAVLSEKFKYIDLEEDLIAPALEVLSRDKGVRIIRSFHDFNGIPKDLSKKLMSVKRSENEIPKAAVNLRNSADVLEFYKEALLIKDEEKIVIGMGNFGVNTRILAGKIGSYLTFSSKEGNEAAPGHMSPRVLNRLYRIREINNDTPIMGIIGNPVMHTKSPKIHNEGYIKLDIPGVYVPFETDNLEKFIELANLLEIKGFSVTVPFKNDIIEHLDLVSEGVEQIGACNTVYKEEGKWLGENSDYIGFIDPLKREFGNLKGKKVSVIGAGGAAKAAVYALIKEGAEVLILNRTIEKAADIANKFWCYYEPLNSYSTDLIKRFSDIIVQTTNVGMHPMEHINPLNFYNFKGNEFLYDIIYAPEKTVFLKKGEQAGCRILNGWDMLLEQGYKQFKLFTNREYPV